MSRSLTPSAYSPERGKEDRGGRTEKRTLGGAERIGRVTSYLLTETPPGTAPHDPCPDQQRSRDRQAANCDLGAESGPLSLGSGSRWGPSNRPSLRPAFIIRLDCLLSQALCGSQGLPADEPSLCPPGALRPRRRWEEM